MSNSYYNHSTFPTQGAAGTSASMRAELDLITTGFNLLPTLAANTNKIVTVNSTSDALTVSAATLTAAGALAGITTLGMTGALTYGGVTLTANVTGTGKMVLDTSPTLVSPALGTPTALVGTNITGTATGLTAGAATTAGTASAVTSNINLPGSPTTTTQSAADNSTKVATTAYVDSAVASGISKEAVKYATTAALATVVYVNGTSGVGATLTGFSVGALSVDSAAPSVNDRIGVKNQASSFQNGIYIVTATGSAGAVFVLTRATDFDQSTDIKTGDAFFVTAGTANTGTSWTCNSADSPVIGTDAITFVQSGVANGATLGANTFTGLQTFLNTKDTVYTITDGAAFEIDPANGNFQLVTLGASRTPKATNFADGQGVILGIDDGTAYTVTWTDGTLSPIWTKVGGTGVAPTLATTGKTWVALWKVNGQIYGGPGLLP